MRGFFVEKKKNFFKGLSAPKNSYNFVFIAIMLIVVLFMDIANVSYETDSIQLYLAFLYSIYISTKMLGDENVNEAIT